MPNVAWGVVVDISQARSADASKWEFGFLAFATPRATRGDPRQGGVRMPSQLMVLIDFEHFATRIFSSKNTSIRGFVEQREGEER
jgi:hypothetical protein